MRRALFALAAALVLATTVCTAAGGGGIPKDAPANATAAPSSTPPVKSDPPDYGY